MERIERFRGCLLGLAVGDAEGTTLEFKPPGTFEPITDMVSRGRFGLKPGQWTDDTSMALCLAASLTERGQFDERDQMQRYVKWWRDRYMSSTGTCFDIGSTTSYALSTFQRTGNPFAGFSDPNIAGNGSLMRLAPVPLCQQLLLEWDSPTSFTLNPDPDREARSLLERFLFLRYVAGDDRLQFDLELIRQRPHTALKCDRE